MIDLLKKNGNFYKANLHCHTTLSDGKMSPEEVKAHYMKNGYSIVAFTDHSKYAWYKEMISDDFLPLAGNYPDLLLNIELKDYPEEFGEDFAFESADRICDMIISYNLEDRTWINSFSGKLLEYVYKKHGRTFYYHGFYPWFILGKMELDPESFIDVACMQHRYIDENGEVQKYKDNLCPEEWFTYLLSKGIMPLVAPSLKEYPLYDKAFSYGSRIVNIDNPMEMIKHLNSQY